MLASQKSHRRFVAANHDRPARPALVDAFGASPRIAARHEACVARIMHRVIGLNGQLPAGTNGLVGITRTAEENRAAVLSALRENGPSSTAEVARIVGLQRDRAGYYLSVLSRLGRVTKTQPGRLLPVTWRVVG